MTRLRVAVVASPRSGNSWVRQVLRDSLDLQDYAVHNYLDLPDPFSERAVLQIHWPREPNFQAFLRKHEFKVVALRRHPLDILLSVLHFVRREPATSRWLEGNAEIPPDLAQASPTSPEFKRFATGLGAENLLAVGYQWSFEPAAVFSRYEDLVATPREGFHSLVSQLGGNSEQLDTALGRNTIATFQAMSNRHGWQGRPGLWRQLIPWPAGRHIAKRHQHVFTRMEYTVPFHMLSERRAERNWTRLVHE